jgi:hypothetical protein
MAAAHLGWPGMRVTIKCVASLSRQERGRVLAAAGPERGAPVYFRNDNGPEFIAKAVREWNAGRGLQTIYVETGTRWQKACSESFKSRLCDQLFNRENFARLSEAKVLGRDYHRSYNEQRPQSSLNYGPPVEFAQCFQSAAYATLRQSKGRTNSPNKPNSKIKPQDSTRLSKKVDQTPGSDHIWTPHTRESQINSKISRSIWHRQI